MVVTIVVLAGVLGLLSYCYHLRKKKHVSYNVSLYLHDIIIYLFLLHRSKECFLLVQITIHMEMNFGH